MTNAVFPCLSGYAGISTRMSRDFLARVYMPGASSRPLTRVNFPEIPKLHVPILENTKKERNRENPPAVPYVGRAVVGRCRCRVIVVVPLSLRRLVGAGYGRGRGGG